MNPDRPTTTYAELLARHCAPAGDVRREAQLGPFLRALSDEELAGLALACEALDEGEPVGELRDDLAFVTLQVLRAEQQSDCDAQLLAVALAKLSLCVSLARLARLGFIEVDVDELRLVGDELPASRPTDKAYLLLGGPEGGVLH